MATGFSDRDQAEVQPLQRGRLTLSVFRAFVETRPDEEHWELIDGAAMMMTPPTWIHQRIASNLEVLLNNAFRERKSRLRAFQGLGVNIAPDVNNYDPEPDVTVVSVGELSDPRYSDRFYLAAEVVSPSDQGRTESKRDVYKIHKHCGCILTIMQDRCEVRVDQRTADGWQVRILQNLNDLLSLPELGLQCLVADIYVETPVGMDGTP